jgi:hypothetical protein
MSSYMSIQKTSNCPELQFQRLMLTGVQPVAITPFYIDNTIIISHIFHDWQRNTYECVSSAANGLLGAGSATDPNDGNRRAGNYKVQ